MKRGLAVFALVAMLVVAVPSAAQAGWAPRRVFRSFVNNARVERGLPKLYGSPTLRRLADAHTERMRNRGYIFHSSLSCFCGEIVGVVGRGDGHPIRRLFRAFMDSRTHREIILGRFRRIGIGVRGGDSFIWLTGIFK